MIALDKTPTIGGDRWKDSDDPSITSYKMRLLLKLMLKALLPRAITMEEEVLMWARITIFFLQI